LIIRTIFLRIFWDLSWKRASQLISSVYLENSRSYRSGWQNWQIWLVLVGVCRLFEIAVSQEKTILNYNTRKGLAILKKTLPVVEVLIYQEWTDKSKQILWQINEKLEETFVPCNISFVWKSGDTKQDKSLFCCILRWIPFVTQKNYSESFIGEKWEYKKTFQLLGHFLFLKQVIE